MYGDVLLSRMYGDVLLSRMCGNIYEGQITASIFLVLSMMISRTCLRCCSEYIDLEMDPLFSTHSDPYYLGVALLKMVNIAFFCSEYLSTITNTLGVL
jgi:hypothetical protein